VVGPLHWRAPRRGVDAYVAPFKGSTADVQFDAIPGGADVRVDGQYLGATPTQGELSRNQSQTVVVSKEGYVDQYVQVKRHPDTPWWFWDIGTCVIPVTLCIPLLVDAISGGWMSLDDNIRVKLDPKPGTPPAPGPSAAAVLAPPPTVIVPAAPPPPPGRVGL
jgi:hypothetical protein